MLIIQGKTNVSPSTPATLAREWPGWKGMCVKLLEIIMLK